MTTTTPTPPDMPELLPCPFCGAAGIRKNGWARCSNDRCAMSDVGWGTYGWNTRPTPPADALPTEENEKRLKAIIERDRTKVFEAHRAIEKTLSGVDWLGENRGPYEYDDEEYQKEFGRAIKAIRNSIVPLRHIAQNMKDCPDTHAEALAARSALHPAPVTDAQDKGE